MQVITATESLLCEEESKHTSMGTLSIFPVTDMGYREVTFKL